MAKTILIKDGHIWSACDDYVADVFISDGKIRAIGLDLAKQYSADEIIDAHGLYVFPGGVDVHTHMELPFMGTFSSDDFETGTLAGLHGGTTTIVDFAMQTRGSPLKDCINAWHDRAKKAMGDYGFHCGVTDYNENTQKEIPELISQGVTSFKAFMAYKGALMTDDRQLLGLMGDAKRHGALVSVHAENGDLIDSLVHKFRSEGKFEPKYHALAHADIAEAEAASRAMDLANYLGSDLYIVHTTCRKVLESLKEKMRRDQNVYIETCIQYLTLDDSCYEEPDFGGAKYVVSPPIRKKDDQAALWAGIAGGYVQVVATDHCPFNFKGQKEMGRGDFSKIPNGGGVVEHRIELGFSEGVAKGRISMNQFVAVMCTNPARIFGMPDKGSIAVGKDADIVLFDPNENHVLGAATHHMRVDYSMFEGWKVCGRVKTVIANGRVAIRDGRADDVGRGQGRFIKRKPFRRS